MSVTVRKELLDRFPPTDDPVIRARRCEIVQALLKAHPEFRQQIVEEGRLREARAMVRRVLTRRGLALGPDDDARIEGCEDLAALERWFDQALTATSVADALR